MFEVQAHTLLQLDIIFAVANNEGKNPVTVSRSGDIPEAGTIEAERALGRGTNNGANAGPRKRRLSNVSDHLRRAISGDKANGTKGEQRFSENAEKRV